MTFAEHFIVKKKKKKCVHKNMFNRTAARPPSIEAVTRIDIFQYMVYETGMSLSEMKI